MCIVVIEREPLAYPPQTRHLAEARRLEGDRNLTTAVDSDGERERWPVGTVRVMRSKLGPARAATVDDPLGRLEVGYRPGLAASDLWDRGRGVWKAQVAQVIASELLLVAADGAIQMVGTVDGLAKHGDRIAVTGTPLVGHPLIGEPDPIANSSRNPVAYGEITLSEDGRLAPGVGRRPRQRNRRGFHDA
jgi:hypothetical protein